ncbi:tyrosine-type recombinase/integrase [Leptolyngbya sp. CCNP1308]|uniref:tyrosine-type recombinase/integrase n=1 Tax=Leptolyngbya sp. CCNP1308 TaxID=3110255 RepID=UPI002B1F4271|nr:tyrosine-type recombinase/integrase [Leptolyngbya sp. CCNP1308]MEA5448516.1 tyrosine-type recombinase/integrase [Leptolyngbya sp. CCNP1308]
MIEDTAQSLKVEQSDMGTVLDAASRFKPVKLAVVAGGENSSPFKGHKATGRSREYLTGSEIAKLIDAAKAGQRNAHRNYMAVLLTFRHGLRASEVADLRWSDISFEDGTILCRRIKGSKDSTHYLEGDELRGLRRLQREGAAGPFVFTDSKGSPLTQAAISAMVKRLGKGLFAFPIHAHMLRHACGYYLANRGVDTRTIQDYLGHRNIQNTERYTQLAPNKFKGLWS